MEGWESLGALIRKRTAGEPISSPAVLVRLVNEDLITRNYYNLAFEFIG